MGIALSWTCSDGYSGMGMLWHPTWVCSDIDITSARVLLQHGVITGITPAWGIITAWGNAPEWGYCSGMGYGSGMGHCSGMGMLRLRGIGPHLHCSVLVHSISLVWYCILFMQGNCLVWLYQCNPPNPTISYAAILYGSNRRITQIHIVK